MTIRDEDYFRACSRGDLIHVRNLFDSLDREQIESIRDTHKARYENIIA